jgi:acyl carrier protein
MSNLENEVKQLIIEALNLEDMTIDDIDSNEPLFVEGLGLDSIDALELGVAMKKKYNITINSEDDTTNKHFESVVTLAIFIEQNRGE